MDLHGHKNKKTDVSYKYSKKHLIFVLWDYFFSLIALFSRTYAKVFLILYHRKKLLPWLQTCVFLVDIICKFFVVCGKLFVGLVAQSLS